VEAELRRLVLEIEGMEGKLKRLGDQVAFATLRVTFEARTAPSAKTGPFELPFRWLDQLGLRRLMELSNAS
jgi:hypothetical protein